MKKLIVMIGVACAAAFVHGANVQWGVDRNATTMTQNATVYAFLAADAAKVNTALGNTTAVSGFETALATAGVSYSGGYSNGTGNGRGAVSGTLIDSGIADNSDVSLMLVVFDSAGENYTTVSGVTGHSFTAETAATGVKADFSSSFSSATWTPVSGGSSGGGAPEPTSGLLLLVGAGILGLRRKRA